MKSPRMLATRYSPTPSLLSQQQAEEYAFQLEHEVSQEIQSFRTVSKSCSLAPLFGSRKKSISQQLTKKWYLDHRGEIQSQIKQLQKNCDKFGGSEYIRDQMNRQAVTPKEQARFYKDRILSIHGSLSLPKISHVRGRPDQDDASALRSASKGREGKSERKSYNKWFIRPKSRFSHKEDKKIVPQPSIDKYIQQVLRKGNFKTNVKSEYASIMIKESARRLGREPLVSGSITICRT